MIDQDLKEAYNKNIDYIDYLASFSNPKGVEETRRRRETVVPESSEEREQFNALIKDMFGREVE